MTACEKTITVLNKKLHKNGLSMLFNCWLTNYRDILWRERVSFKNPKQHANKYMFLNTFVFIIMHNRYLLVVSAHRGWVVIIGLGLVCPSVHHRFSSVSHNSMNGVHFWCNKWSSKLDYPHLEQQKIDLSVITDLQTN